MTDVPAPLTPADSDLSRFPFMPLDVARLRSSDLASVASAEAFRAAVLLWCACWHQKPAASLPDDDRVLAQLAGFGRFVKEWRKVRDESLRGFVKCSDGRIYHRIVAEKAIEALGRKEAQRQRTEAAREAARNRKRDSGGDNGGGSDATGSVTAKPKTPLQAPKDMDMEIDKDRDKPPPDSASPATPAWAVVVEAVNHPWLDPNKSQNLLLRSAIVGGWISAGADLELDIIPTVRALLAELAPSQAPITTWNYFDKAVRRNTAARLAAEQPQAKIEPEILDARSNEPRRNGQAPGGLSAAFVRRKARQGREDADGAPDGVRGAEDRDGAEPDHGIAATGVG